VILDHMSALARSVSLSIAVGPDNQDLGYIDMGAAGPFFAGQLGGRTPGVVVVCETTMTGTAVATFNLVAAVQTTDLVYNTGIVVASSPLIASGLAPTTCFLNNLAAGDRVVIPIPPRSTAPTAAAAVPMRYLGLMLFAISGAVTGGKVSAYFTPDVSDIHSYPNGSC